MKPITLIMAVIACWLGSVEMTLADGHPPLPDAMQHTRHIAYTPRGFAIVGGKPMAAPKASIRADLKLLRPFFDGLITYASNNGMEAVPGIARELAYRSVIMGIWDPLSEVEIQNVIAAAKRYPTLVTAVIIGNEGIYTKRYQPEDVQKVGHRLKRECPSLAVTTSEPFFLYFKKEYTDFFNGHDLLMPNVHPVFEPWFKPSAPSQGVSMILNVAGQFKTTYRRPLLIKETGLPSGPTGQSDFSPERQALFWSELFARFPTAAGLSFACFEAFDAPWKPAATAVEFPGNHASEAFWGFFTATGKGKPVIDALPKLSGR